MLVSRRPPLLLLALPQDAETLPGILTSRAFTVPLGERTAACHLHATADGGQNALLIGTVISVS
jgi:flavin reductase (DIM6/NTAB) family NADH-FMN oxidoreductase RutF